jgi:hypothetical protein
MPRKKPTLVDVDGRRLGKAVMVIVDIARIDDDPRALLHQSITEGPKSPSPIRAAQALWAATMNDWPNHTMTVVADHRATYINWRNNMADLLGGSPDDYPPADYLETFNGR